MKLLKTVTISVMIAIAAFLAPAAFALEVTPSEVYTRASGEVALSCDDPDNNQIYVYDDQGDQATSMGCDQTEVSSIFVYGTLETKFVTLVEADYSCTNFATLTEIQADSCFVGQATLTDVGLDGLVTPVQENTTEIVFVSLTAVAIIFAIMFFLNVLFPKFFKIDKSSPFGL